MKQIFTILLVGFYTALSAQTYVPDPAFGTNGRVVTTYNTFYGNDAAPTTLDFVDNKYIFGQKTQLSCFLPDGNVDYTFGTMGYRRIEAPGTVFTIFKCVYIGNDIYVVGYADVANQGAAGFIAKMNIDGQMDATFGLNGVAMIDIGYFLYTESRTGVEDVVLKDGKLFLVANRYPSGGGLYRLNLDGTIDYSFDANGYKIYVAPPTPDLISSIKFRKIHVYQDDLLLIGQPVGAHQATIFKKVNEQGNPVTSFAPDGLKQIVYVGASCSCGYTSSNYVFVGNDVYFILGYGASSMDWKKICKLNLSAATLQTETLMDWYGMGWMSPVQGAKAFQISGNKMYTIDKGTGQFAVSRYNLNGTLDTTFNSTGQIVYGFTEAEYTSSSDASVMYLHNDGSFLLGGYCSGINGWIEPKGFAMLKVADQSQLGVPAIDVSSKVSIAPNPVYDQFEIRSDGNDPATFIELYDLTGKQLIAKEIGLEKIDISNLTNGAYFVKIRMLSGQSKNVKILKK